MNYSIPNKKLIQKNPSTVLNCNLNEVTWCEVDTKTINERKEKRKRRTINKKGMRFTHSFYRIVLTSLTIIQSKKIGK